jgi:hypothetical protein
VCALTQLGNALAAAPSRSEAALQTYDEALARAGELGMLPFQALSLEGKGAVFTALRNSESARACFDRAHELWQGMNAPARVERLAKLRAF